MKKMPVKLAAEKLSARPQEVLDSAVAVMSEWIQKAEHQQEIPDVLEVVLEQLSEMHLADALPKSPGRRESTGAKLNSKGRYTDMRRRM
jgi:hypothetical protein